MDPIVEKRREFVADAARHFGSRLEEVFERFIAAGGDLQAAGFSAEDAEALQELFGRLARLTEGMRAKRGEPSREVFPGIEMTPQVNAGKPRLAGTRIFVALFYWHFSSGGTFAEILRGFPHLTREQIETTVRYAALLSREALRDAARKAS